MWKVLSITNKNDMIQLINRPSYTERIAPFINKNIIKVLTGQRRVGKSCILRQIQNHIQQMNPDSNTICKCWKSFFCQQY